MTSFELAPRSPAFEASATDVQSNDARAALEDSLASKRCIARHAFFWLLATNSAGVAVAALLIWPKLNTYLAPLTYGRWVPLHLNWALYGWSSLPVIGALLVFFHGDNSTTAYRGTRLALGVWSLAVLAGATSWLAGVTSGKLFMDWAGWARALLPLAMVTLWLVLTVALLRRGKHLTPASRVFSVSLLTMLAGVPAIFYWASDRRVYPPVNPDSGGATGASLLGSTLVVVAVAGLLPTLLGAKAERRVRLRQGVFWGALGCSFGVYAVIGHGNVSHHALSQITGLSTLLVWPVLTWIHFSRFDWHSSSRPWWLAAYVWWLILILSGFLSFLPTILEQWKFTHVLVGHGHLAMAGFITSLNLAILRQWAPAPSNTRTSFWTWQSACALHIGVMFALGIWEPAHAFEMYTVSAVTGFCFMVRFGTGVVMTAVAFHWWREGWR